jgi:hypothetical protein
MRQSRSAKGCRGLVEVQLSPPKPCRAENGFPAPSFLGTEMEALCESSWNRKSRIPGPNESHILKNGLCGKAQGTELKKSQKGTGVCVCVCVCVWD